MNKERLLDALNVLKETCEEQHGMCDKCPMGSIEGTCIINEIENYPCNWDIEQDTEVWRAVC